MSSPTKSVQALAKFLAYVLGRRPDEFGLVPDEEGYFKSKDLLHALHAEPGWGFVRAHHLNELQFDTATDIIEMQETRVRARERGALPQTTLPADLPKLMYLAVRRRAYPAVHAHGLRASASSPIILSSQPQMAQKIGKRRDPQPVLITVQIATAQAAGVTFRCYGETLFLADHLPAEALHGPPLPKVAAQPKAPPAALQPKTPGSFFPDMLRIERPSAAEQQAARKGEKSWKQDRRAARRHKERQQNNH